MRLCTSEVTVPLSFVSPPGRLTSPRFRMPGIDLISGINRDVLAQLQYLAEMLPPCAPQDSCFTAYVVNISFIG